MGSRLGHHPANQSAPGHQGAPSNGRRPGRHRQRPVGTGRAGGYSPHHQPRHRDPMKLAAVKSNSSRASVLIIVLWVAFGLVAITLYFANAMSMELKAADNR